ncbi:MAG: putative sensor domain DACNV-containing protein, partial [Terracidiphilus sp.]
MSESYPKDLASHVQSALTANRKRAPALAALVNLFEVLYFASLKTEEGQGISCRVAFINRKRPDPNPPKRIVADRWQYFAFESEIPCSVRNLVKLSKAADSWVSTIAVDQGSDGRLAIWGLIDQSVHYSTAVMNETQSWGQMPGLFQAAIQGTGEIGIYDGYTFLGSLRQGALVTRESGVLQHGPIREKLLPAIHAFRDRVATNVGKSAYDIRAHWDGSLEHHWISTLSRILIGIRRYGHGGALLLTDEAGGLRVKYPLSYTRLSDALVRQGALLVRHTNYSDSLMEEFLDKRSRTVPTDLYLDESVT